MQKRTVNNKDLYIVSSHNQVLEAWEVAPGLNVFSLDYHTDTRDAFQNYSYWRADSEAKAGKCGNQDTRTDELKGEKIRQYLDGRISMDQINDNLRHDEHIDFAVRTNLINLAFILSTNRNETSSNPNVFIDDSDATYQNQRIIEYSPSCVPDCRNGMHEGACMTLRADSVIEDFFLTEAVSRAGFFNSDFFEHYILDIDCDYFNTDQSLFPGRMDVFLRLIREASFLTIALEPECVKICRHDDCGLTCDTILQRLIEIIEMG